MPSEVKMPEPDAYLFQNDETGLVDIVDAQQVEWGFEKNNPRWKRCGEMYEAATLKAYADAKVREALEALRDIANVLGGGPCSDNTCRGCAFEHEEAARIADNAIRALTQEGKT